MAEANILCVDLDTLSIIEHLEVLERPPKGISISQYKVHILKIQNSLFQRFKIRVKEDKLMAGLMSFLPMPIREYLLKHHITEYQKAIDTAIQVERIQHTILMSI
jgi:hypothetical protein